MFDKMKILILKTVFLIITVMNLYFICVDLYPMLIHDLKISRGNGFLPEFCLIFIWFVLLCILIYIKQPKELELPYMGKERQMIFLLPLILLLMNLIIAFISFLICIEDLWRSNMIFTETNCLLFVFLVIAIVLYTGIKNNILIWYPISLFCSIYAMPTGEYSDSLGGGLVVIVMGIGIIVFGIIEYGVMLFLNHRKWYIPKDKKKN